VGQLLPQQTVQDVHEKQLSSIWYECHGRWRVALHGVPVPQLPFLRLVQNM